jgi:hypothetical protein
MVGTCAGAACLAVAFGLPTVGNAATKKAAFVDGTMFVDGTIVPIRGPATASYGSRYTMRGRTGTVNGVHFTGSVVLRGRWNRGAWLTLARTRTDSHGTYSITIHLLRRGRLQLRLLIPGGVVATKTLRVD